MKTRESARLIVVDPKKRVLLLKFEVLDVYDNSGPRKNPFWATVGGEIEEGEDFQEALLRELQEETGIKKEEALITECIWFGEHNLNWSGEMVRCHERFAVAYVNNLNLQQNNMTPGEKQVVKGYKWWTLQELQTSSAVIYPPNLAELLEPILKDVLPGKPIRIEL